MSATISLVREISKMASEQGNNRGGGTFEGAAA